MGRVFLDIKIRTFIAIFYLLFFSSNLVAQELIQTEAETVSVQESIPYNSEAIEYLKLGRKYLEKKDYPKTIEVLEKAIKLSPDFAESYFYLGVAYGKSGKLEKEIEFYQKSIELNIPDLKKVYLNLATAYAEQKVYVQAITYCQKALQLDPNYALALANLGLILVERGNSFAALEQYQKLLVIKREDLAARLKDYLDRQQNSLPRPP